MKAMIDFLYLDEQQMLRAGVTDMARCICSMEDMFALLYRGDYRMGGEDANEHGIRVSFPRSSEIAGMPLHQPDYRFMAMPAYLGGRFRVFGVKTYGSHHTNKEKGLPRSILMMSLLDADTGAPLAYMSANLLSAMRTAAVVGVGTRTLCKKNPVTLGIVGPGVMSSYSLDAILLTQPTIRRLRVKGRGAASLNRFLERAKEKYPFLEAAEAVDSVEAVCRDADIVFFGTSNADCYEDNPRIELPWIKRGAMIISASSLLVSTDFLAAPGVRLIADNYRMYEGWGGTNPPPTQKTVSTLLGMGFYDAVREGKLPRSAITDIGGVIVGEAPGRENDEQIVVYAVGGMPVEDVAWGYDCWKRALEIGAGQTLKLWDEPALMR